MRVTQLSTYSEPILKSLAKDYAETVRLGEITVAARITIYRAGTRYLCWASVAGAAAYVAAA